MNEYRMECFEERETRVASELWAVGMDTRNG